MWCVVCDVWCEPKAVSRHPERSATKSKDPVILDKRDFT